MLSLCSQICGQQFTVWSGSTTPGVTYKLCMRDAAMANAKSFVTSSSPETSGTTSTAAAAAAADDDDDDDASGGDAVVTGNDADQQWSAVDLLVERKSKRYI